MKDKVVLITGASAGIGAGLALALAQQFPGIRLGLTARRLDRLTAIAASCQAAGAEVQAIAADVTQSDSVQALVEQTLQHFGRIDVLVNNAGYGQMGPIELIPLADCRRQYEVNVLGMLALTQPIIPIMRQQGQGRIINISSIGGRIAFPMGGLYSSSKFALEALSDALRMELAPFNIQVVVIEPGPVRTDFFTVAATTVAEAIANPLDTPYRAAFENLDQLEQLTDRQALPVEKVAKVVIQAMTADRPRPRYVAARYGGIILFLMRHVLPTWAVDRFWQRFYGIDRVAEDWQGRK